MFTYSFEKLEVWQESRTLVSKIYSLTKNFPADERYGLTNQIRRAAVSVSSNLAEGTSRKTVRELIEKIGNKLNALYQSQIGKGRCVD